MGINKSVNNPLQPFELVFSPRKITRFFSYIVMFLLTANMVRMFGVYILGYESLDISTFDVGLENNLPATYSAFALLFCALLIAIIAIAKNRQNDRYSLHWKFLSFIFLYVAVDESAGLHELVMPHLRSVMQFEGLFYYNWVILGGLLIVILSIAYFGFLKSLPARTRNLFIAAGVTFVVGGLGIEMISGWHAYLSNDETKNLVYESLGMLEEALEMFGVIIFIYALLEYIKSYLKIRLDFIEK